VLISCRLLCSSKLEIEFTVGFLLFITRRLYCSSANAKCGALCVDDVRSAFFALLISFVTFSVHRLLCFASPPVAVRCGAARSTSVTIFLILLIIICYRYWTETVVSEWVICHLFCSALLCTALHCTALLCSLLCFALLCFAWLAELHGSLCSLLFSSTHFISFHFVSFQCLVLFALHLSVLFFDIVLHWTFHCFSFNFIEFGPHSF